MGKVSVSTVLRIALLAACLACSSALAVPWSATPASDEAATHAALAPLRALLSTPDDQIDFATAKLTIDRLIDPSIDASAVLLEIERLTDAVKARTPAGVTRRGQFDVLLSALYEAGPWNGNRPFTYDLRDPLGKNRRTKLLSTYLSTRKGNCVSMPILVAIIAQRLGLYVTLSTAPQHVLVKFVGDQGRWLNVEATAGGYKYDSSYERETGISQLAIQNRIYLRPLSPRAAAGVMASTLMEHYAAHNNGDGLMAVADMVLAVNPKDTVAIIQKANAYYLQLQQRFVSKYPRPMDIPQPLRADFERLSRANLAWFERAEQLGWTPPSLAQEEAYLQSIQREKARREQL